MIMLDILWAYGGALEGRRCAVVFRPVQRVPAHRLRQVVSIMHNWEPASLPLTVCDSIEQQWQFSPIISG